MSAPKGSSIARNDMACALMWRSRTVNVTNATAEPNSARYAIEPIDSALQTASPQSSLSAETGSSRSPPTSIAQPFSTTASSSAARRFWAMLPTDAPSGASASAAAPRAALSSDPSSTLSRKASARPPMPISTPTRSGARSGSSGSSTPASSAVYSGSTPNSTAASPDGTYCSPQYTSPYANANGASASTAARSQSVESGRRWSAAIASRTSPATANRIPAPSSAGQSSRPIFMATQVLDQIRTSMAYRPKTSERLTPIEAIDGPPAAPCHTIA